MISSSMIDGVSVARKNRDLYDNTWGPIWRLVVYDGLHDGWEFVNLAGRSFLDMFARRARLAPADTVLELGSGQGAACRYLAASYRCKVTGVEWNPRQVERARDYLQEAPAKVARRVRFVEANALGWRPSRRYNAAFALDSLMLIEDVPRVLRNICGSLQPSGLFMAAAIAAGPGLDEKMREFSWRMDGIISLLTPEEYRMSAYAAGLCSVIVEDHTRLACHSSARIMTALERSEEKIVRLEGRKAYRNWRELGEVYLGGFRERKLRYLIIAGRRGPAGVAGRDPCRLTRTPTHRK